MYWIYMDKAFNKANHCDYNDQGQGEIPSIANCIGRAPFNARVLDINFCGGNGHQNKPKGVICI